MSLKALFTLMIAAIAMSAGIAHGQASGTGFFITTDGYFVTNQHVVESAKSVVIRTANGKSYPAEVIRVDSANDLAILKAEGTFRALPVQNSQSVRRGDKVFTLGFPNTFLQGVEPKYTDGVISSLTGVRDKPNNYQISVAIQPGNSGGPLISSMGNVVGIVVSKLNVEAALKSAGAIPENVNYAVKSNYLLELISTLPSVRTAMLAVRSKPVGDMSDLAVLAEAAVGLVKVELISESKPLIANSQGTPPQQTPPTVLPGPPLNAAPKVAVSANFPERPVRVIIPFPPGSQSDVFGRTFAKNAAQITGQSFIIENRPGSSGGLGADMVQRMKPDGYTLLLTNENFAINPSVNANAAYNVDSGFIPVSILKASPLVLVVNASMQVTNVSELVALDKNNSGRLKYASSGNGSQSHFAGEVFRAATGTKIVHVPYIGFGPAVQDLLGGNVNAMIGNIEALDPFIRTGRLRPIAVTSTRRAAELPDVPTLAESGFPVIPIWAWLAILAPAETPLEVVNKLNQIIVKTQSPDLQVNARATTPTVAANFIKSEIGKFRRLASAHGIRAD
jgi:tripartite-type tricarboxylate transporter receptor subunit TctC/S1-C subfamily serine protease